MKFIGHLLGRHFERYPAMQLDDVYKLLHQAALGPAHAVAAADAAGRIEAEARDLGDGPDEPLADVISPDGRLARIHLRPYVKAGHSLARLAEAFAATAASYPPAPDKLAKFCGCLGDLADAGGLAFSRAAVEPYMQGRREAGWPAVRHSEPFRSAYRPAYRVVDLTLLPEAAP